MEGLVVSNISDIHNPEIVKIYKGSSVYNFTLSKDEKKLYIATSNGVGFSIVK